MKQQEVLSKLMSLYIISLAFQSLLDLPIVGHRIQIPEFVFLIIGIYMIFNYKKISITFNKFDYVVLSYLCLNILSAVWNGSELTTYLEILGRCYLFGVYFLFKTITSKWNSLKLKKYVINNFVLLGVISSLFALGGWFVAIYSNENNILATAYENYPYLGTVFRIRGATPTPTMLAVLLLLCAFFLVTSILENKQKSKREIIFLSLILVTSFLTFSKTFLLLVFGIGLILLKKMGLFKKINFLEPIAIFLVTLLFIISSHFLIFSSNSNWNEKLETTPFSTNEILFKNDKIIVLESFYIFSKKCAIAVSKMNPILGVGPGNFNNRLEQLDKNKFPALKKLMGVDPHSIYFGTLAENGILGLTCVIYMFYFFVVKLREIIEKDPIFIYSLFLIFILFLIEGITTDIMNFRNLWVIMGISSGLILINDSRR